MVILLPVRIRVLGVPLPTLDVPPGFGGTGVWWERESGTFRSKKGEPALDSLPYYPVLSGLRMGSSSAGSGPHQGVDSSRRVYFVNPSTDTKVPGAPPGPRVDSIVSYSPV